MINDLVKLVMKIPTKKRAFILMAFDYLDISQISYLTGITVENLKEIHKALDQPTKDLLIKSFNADNLRKTEHSLDRNRKKLPKSRYKNYAGFREDLQESFRSKVEANVARYLTARYGRDAWTYEGNTFDISMKTSTGRVKTYTPDFRIILPDGDVFLEIKPMFIPTAKDKTKLKVFRKDYPQHKLIIVTLRQSRLVRDWAAKNNFEVWIWEDLRLFCEEKKLELE